MSEDVDALKLHSSDLSNPRMLDTVGSTGDWFILTSSSNFTSYIHKKWGRESTDLPLSK